MVNEHSIMPTALVLHLKMNRDGSYQKPSALSVQGYRDPSIGQPSPVPPLRPRDAHLSRDSFARLGDLASIQLFYFPANNKAKTHSWTSNQVYGMVLSYNNGAQIAWASAVLTCAGFEFSTSLPK